MLNIRYIERRDNAAVEGIIRECLIEFGGNRDGLAWADDSMHDLYTYYNSAANRAYWIVEEDGEVLGGCGIAPLMRRTGSVSCRKCICHPPSAAKELLQIY